MTRKSVCSGSQFFPLSSFFLSFPLGVLTAESFSEASLDAKFSHQLVFHFNLVESCSQLNITGMVSFLNSGKVLKLSGLGLCTFIKGLNCRYWLTSLSSSLMAFCSFQCTEAICCPYPLRGGIARNGILQANSPTVFTLGPG